MLSHLSPQFKYIFIHIFIWSALLSVKTAPWLSGIMFVHLMLVIYLTATYSSSTTRAQETLRTGETTEIGKVINLAKTNLLEDFKESEASIFETFPLPCYRKENLNFSRSYFEYYESTKAFFLKISHPSRIRCLTAVILFIEHLSQ